MNGKTLLIALLFVAAAGGGYYLLSEDDVGNDETGPAPKIEEQQPEDPQEDEPEVTARQATGQVACDPERVPREKRIETPDGQWVGLLNDSVNVPDFTKHWPGDIPWSPIVRVKTDKTGQQWWVHEDGSQSTSVMVWRQDLNRMDGVLQIANPTEVAPVAPGERPDNDVGPIRPGAGGR